MDKLAELERVRKMLKEIDFVSLTAYLNSFLPLVPIKTIQFENKLFDLNQRETGGHNFLYRARLLNKDAKIPFQTVDEISFIPPKESHKITCFGRVNKPNESMFYSSSSLSTACIETFSKGENFNRFKNNDRLMLVVGSWVIEQPLVLAQMLSPEKYLDHFVKYLKDLKEQSLTLEFLRQENENMRKQINNDEQYNIFEFFSEEFAKTDTIDHNEYKLSNYYKDRVLNNTQKFPIDTTIDGLWYPSVSSGYKDINIAFPPENIQGKLRFVSADLIWVVYFKDQKKIQFIPIEYRAKVNEFGVIQWNTKSLS